MWKEICQADDVDVFRTIDVDEQDWQVLGEFGEDLAAGTAGRSGSGGGDCEKLEVLVAGGDGGKEGGAFGADGEAVGGVFDVAAGEYLAVGGEEGGADEEIGVFGVGALAGVEGGLDQGGANVGGHGRVKLSGGATLIALTQRRKGAESQRVKDEANVTVGLTLFARGK